MAHEIASSASAGRASPAPGEPAPRDERRRRWTALALVWIAAAMYVLPFVSRGWIPHDEGTIAQGAERVASGQVPHRDYDEVYTGGLSYLHAAAFRLFGLRLASMRYALLLFFLAFVPAVYAIASRFAPPWLAGLLTLTAVAWSVPNYFASVASWYNLFFAVFTAWALLRHAETGRRRWLFAAGVFSGVSILFKIVGLYAVAAGLLFLAYREQLGASERRGRGETSPGRALLWLKGAFAAAFAALLVAVFRGTSDPVAFADFVVPGAAVAILLVWSEWRERAGDSARRWRELFALGAIFLLGVAVPLILFTIPFARGGAALELWRAVLRQPARQIDAAAAAPPPAVSLLWALPYAALLAAPAAAARGGRRAAILLGGVLAVLLALAPVAPETYRAIWSSARALLPVSVLAGCALLAVKGSGIARARRERIFLLITMTALVGLVQYPFSAPIYFCYVAPFVAVATAAVVQTQRPAARLLHVVVLVFYLLFAMLWTNRGYVHRLGRYFATYVADAELPSDRGGLRVPAEDARVYGALLSAIRERARGIGFYAGPDCPEVAFLAGFRNPTRSAFDFQGALYGRDDALFDLIERLDSRIVVINERPDFSRPLGATLRARLAARFPHARAIGKFQLLWRD